MPHECCLSSVFLLYYLGQARPTLSVQSSSIYGLVYSVSPASHQQMSFNALKCPQVHLHKNISSVFPFHYSLSQHTLSSSTRCTDLGIVFSSDLSWNSHYQKISSRAYQTLYLIRRTFFATSHIEVKKLLYLSLVRSHLTYCSQLWRPSLIKDIVCLERIQRRATKFILNDYSMDYKSRLTSLGLLPLM